MMGLIYGLVGLIYNLSDIIMKQLICEISPCKIRYQI